VADAAHLDVGHGGKFPSTPPIVALRCDIEVALRCILPSQTVVIWYHNYTRLTTYFFWIDLPSARFEIPRPESTPSRFSPSEPEDHTICPTTTTLSLSGRLRLPRTTGSIRARLLRFAQVRRHPKSIGPELVLTIVQALAVLSPRTTTPFLINLMVCETV
jgi:hypothetical protein